MPSEMKGDTYPSGFAELLGEVKSLINSTPDRAKQCRDGLKSVEENVSQQFMTLQADTKAHPGHKAANDAKIHQLAITLGNALAAYARCTRTVMIKPTET